MLPATLVLAGLVIIGWLFSTKATSFMQDALRTYLRTSAALASMQFSPADIRAVQSPKDIRKPEYVRLVHQLDAIRDGMPSARFAYIFRRTKNAGQLAFVADADGLATLKEVDLNGNGKVDADEEPGQPGELYDTMNEPMLQGPAFLAPIAGDFYVDQWGELISGYAPIYDEQGKVMAVLGIDMRAGEFRRLARSIISPAVSALAVIVGILLAMYIAVIIWRRQMQGLRTLAAERSALIDLAMHQIGAPLAAFRWWTDILEEQDPAKTVVAREEGYKQLHTAIGRMETVIKAMQSASEIQRGTVSYQPEIAPLNTVIDIVAKNMKPALAKSGHQLKIVAEPNLRSRFDPRLIAGVIEELIENAIVYTPACTITLRAEIRMRRIVVSVEDEGPGIPSADRAKIFQPFTRGEDAYKKKPVGNGLGLYVAKSIVEAGGGTITVDSASNTGTTVTFTLPRA